jgi:hypothetical protein
MYITHIPQLLLQGAKVQKVIGPEHRGNAVLPNSKRR